TSPDIAPYNNNDNHHYDNNNISPPTPSSAYYNDSSLYHNNPNQMITPLNSPNDPTVISQNHYNPYFNSFGHAQYQYQQHQNSYQHHCNDHQAQHHHSINSVVPSD